jgi:hypothetical protein
MGRDSQKRAEPVTVSNAAQPTFLDVAAQLDLLSKVGEKSGRSYLRVPSHQYGVSFISYVKDTGMILAFVEVAQLNYKFEAYAIHPYPMAGFISVPTRLDGFKVGLIIRFTDALVVRTVPDISELIANSRIGSTIDEPLNKLQVSDMASGSFRRIEL